MNRSKNASLPYAFRSLTVLSLLLLGAALLVGCGGKTASDLPDAKTVEAHKLRPPISSAVPQGMNK